MGMKQPKRPTESKPGKVVQTCNSPTNSTRIDLSYSYRVLGDVGTTSRVRERRMVAKADTPSEVQTMLHSAGSSRNLVRTFTRRNWVEVAGA